MLEYRFYNLTQGKYVFFPVGWTIGSKTGDEYSIQLQFGVRIWETSFLIWKRINGYRLWEHKSQQEEIILTKETDLLGLVGIVLACSLLALCKQCTKNYTISYFLNTQLQKKLVDIIAQDKFYISIIPLITSRSASVEKLKTEAVRGLSVLPILWAPED